MNKTVEGFGVFSEALLLRLREASRIILIANNPAIQKSDVDDLDIGSDDIVVSFNTCINSHLLSKDWVNLLVHGFNEPDRYFFGLPCRPEVDSLMSRKGSGFTMLMGCTGHMSPVPGTSLVWARFDVPAIRHYPVLRPDGKHYAGPSTGFSTLAILDWWRQVESSKFKILTLGFSNEAGKLWRGHAWNYERDWLKQANITPVPLKPKAWWARLFRR